MSSGDAPDASASGIASSAESSAPLTNAARGERDGGGAGGAEAAGRGAATAPLVGVAPLAARAGTAAAPPVTRGLAGAATAAAPPVTRGLAGAATAAAPPVTRGLAGAATAAAPVSFAPGGGGGPGREPAPVTGPLFGGGVLGVPSAPLRSITADGGVLDISLLASTVGIGTSSSGGCVFSGISPLTSTVPVSVGPLRAEDGRCADLPPACFAPAGTSQASGSESASSSAARSSAAAGRLPGTGGGAVGAFPRGSCATPDSSGSRSKIASSISRAWRATDPGGGGGIVFCLRRGALAGTPGSGADLTGSGPGVSHPAARSAMRPFVSSPSRRRFRSSSGTGAR